MVVKRKNKQRRHKGLPRFSPRQPSSYLHPHHQECTESTPVFKRTGLGQPFLCRSRSMCQHPQPVGEMTGQLSVPVNTNLDRHIGRGARRDFPHQLPHAQSSPSANTLTPLYSVRRKRFKRRNPFLAKGMLINLLCMRLGYRVQKSTSALSRASRFTF